MRVPLILAVSLLSGGHAIPGDCNDLILEAIRKMPAGGVYARYREEESGDARFTDLFRTVDDLAAAMTMNQAGSIEVNPLRAKEFSFCSSATYLVFCEVISTLQAKGVIGSDPSIFRELHDIGEAGV